MAPQILPRRVSLSLVQLWLDYDRWCHTDVMTWLKIFEVNCETVCLGILAPWEYYLNILYLLTFTSFHTIHQQLQLLCLKVWAVMMNNVSSSQKLQTICNKFHENTGSRCRSTVQANIVISNISQQVLPTFIMAIDKIRWIIPQNCWLNEFPLWFNDNVLVLNLFVLSSRAYFKYHQHFQ